MNHLIVINTSKCKTKQTLYKVQLVNARANMK